MLSLGLIKDKKRVNIFQQDMQKITRVLNDKKLFEILVEKNSSFFKKGYEKYKEGCYKDERYKHYRGANFTAYISKYLTLRLNDLYKRKELIDRHYIPLWEEDEQLQKQNTQSRGLDYSIFDAEKKRRELNSVLTKRERAVLMLREEEVGIC